MLHMRAYFSCMCYQIAPRVLHFSAFITPSIEYGGEVLEGDKGQVNALEYMHHALTLSTTHTFILPSYLYNYLTLH